MAPAFQLAGITWALDTHSSLFPSVTRKRRERAPLGGVTTSHTAPWLRYIAFQSYDSSCVALHYITSLHLQPGSVIVNELIFN